MGSFNTTCFASGQTITPGDSVYIFPIHQQHTYKKIKITSPDGITSEVVGISHSNCYPTAFWDYVGPFLLGEYDDYGRFSLTNSDSNIHNLVLFFNRLHEKIFDMDEGENEYHDLPLKFRELYSPTTTYSFEELSFIWGKLEDEVGENRAFINVSCGDTWEPRSLQFAVIHSFTAEYLIDFVAKQKNWDGKVTGSPEDYFKRESEVNFKKYVIYTIYINSEPGFFPGDLYKNHIDLNSIFLNSQREQIDEDFINQLWIEYKDECTHRFINRGLNLLNLKLTPMVYTSQDYENEIGRDFLRMVRSVNTIIKKKIKAEQEKWG